MEFDFDFDISFAELLILAISERIRDFVKAAQSFSTRDLPVHADSNGLLRSPYAPHPTPAFRRPEHHARQRTATSVKDGFSPPRQDALARRTPSIDDRVSFL